MSDVLTVSGGGRITVAGDDLLVAVARCRLLADRLEGLAPDVPLAASAGRLALEVLAARLRITGYLLAVVLDAYSAAERGAARMTEAAADQAAYWTGLLAPVAAATLPSPVLVLATGWLAAGHPGVTLAPAQQRQLLSDPRFVAALRLATGAADDGLRGALRVPWFASQLADDRAGGVLGREAAARMLLGGLIVSGAAAPGPVMVQRVDREPVRPPRSLADLADRIPPPVDGGPQVRVERYDGVTAVYVGGTVDLRLGRSEEPWDLESNVAAVGGSRADSVQAAADVLAAAGVGPDDPIVLVGYSQGGLVASRLAESGAYRVTGMLTLGSPGSSLPVPRGVPVLELEHSEDLVPALAGPQRAESPDRVTATRSLYDGKPPDSPLAVPAHQLDEYRATAAIADGTAEERVSGVRTLLLDRFGAAEVGEASYWHATREPEVSGGAGLPEAAAPARGAR